jgi:molybdopterin/thiamine biosynthesis adenylyltransferase
VTNIDQEPDYLRQLDIVSPTQLATPIHIIGVGGLGSAIALLLAKMGASQLILWDPDTVETHNLPNQWYMLSDVGRPKVEAMADVLANFTGNRPEVHAELFEDQAISGIVISGVDSMLVRAALWKRMKYNMAAPRYIDCRMGGQFGHVYVVNPCLRDNIVGYEQSLYTDDQATDDPCTARAVMYNTLAIATVVGRVVTTIVRNEEMPFEGIVKLVDTRGLQLI